MKKLLFLIIVILGMAMISSCTSNNARLKGTVEVYPLKAGRTSESVYYIRRILFDADTPRYETGAIRTAGIVDSNSTMYFVLPGAMMIFDTIKNVNNLTTRRAYKTYDEIWSAKWNAAFEGKTEEEIWNK